MSNADFPQTSARPYLGYGKIQTTVVHFSERKHRAVLRNPAVKQHMSYFLLNTVGLLVFVSPYLESSLK